MKKIIKSIFSLVLSISLLLSFSLVTFAAESTVTVSLSGKNCGLLAGNTYQVTLNVSDVNIGGIQGRLKFDNTNFVFQNVTVPSSIAKVNRLTKDDKEIITTKDIINVVGNGSIDFVILSDKATAKLLTFNFKVSENAANINNSTFTLNNVKVSQSGGEKRVETVDITGITASSHKYGEWTVTKEPTLFTVGVKSRKCSVCGEIETADVEKLSATAPKLKLLGATRIVLLSEKNREYSLDGSNWQTSNIFIGLSADTEYSVYSRQIDTISGNVSGVSKPLNVTTTDIDCIVGKTQAKDLSGLRKALIFSEKFAWADVNGDTVIDVRDVIRLKKVSADYYAKYEMGDFNHDGVLDSADYNILSDYLTGKSESINAYIGDVNGDNLLDTNDLDALK